MNRIHQRIVLAVLLCIVAISAGCTGAPGQGNATPTTTATTTVTATIPETTLTATATAFPTTVSTTVSTTTPTTPVSESVTVNLTARNVAFDTATITVPRSAAVTINFDNQDSMPHNFALYTNASASRPVYTGEIVTGPRQIAYTFTAPDQPGTYFFRCDVHPVQMTGDFVVT